MANAKHSDDSIQRAYLRKFLARLMKGSIERGLSSYEQGARDVIDQIRAWLNAEAHRTQKPGGIGRR